MKIHYTILATLILSLISVVFPLNLSAATIKSGGDIFISTEETLEDNVYVGAGTSRIEGNIIGDLTVGGGDTVITGTVDGDLFVAGGQVQVDGAITGDVRLVGGTVRVNGIVSGDTVLVGGNSYIGSDAELNGDAIIIGGRVFIDGELTQFTKILAGNVQFNNRIVGETHVTTQKATFASNSHLTKEAELVYFSPKKLIQNDGATIDGEVKYNQIRAIQDSNIIKQTFLNFVRFWVLLRFVTTILIAFLLVYIFRVFSYKVAERGLEAFGKSFLIGLLFLLFAPVVALILGISLVAIPIGIILVLFYIFVSIIASACAGIILGVLLDKVWKRSEEMVISFQTATIGVIALTVVSFVPYIGDATRLIFVLIAIGSIVHYFYGLVRRPRAINS